MRGGAFPGGAAINLKTSLANAMNNKELEAALSERLGIEQKLAGRLLDVAANSIVQSAKQGNQVQLYGFGSFEVRKKQDRILINPATKRQMIVPPKLTFAFKPGGTLKDRLAKMRKA